MPKKPTSQKNEEKEKKPSPSHLLDRSQGTTYYLYDRLISGILPALIRDLVRHEAEGYTDDHCGVIYGFLGRLTAQARPLNGGTLLVDDPRTLRILENFQDAYYRWNGVNGRAQAHQINRGLLIIELRKVRKKAARRKRKGCGQMLLSVSLDRAILLDLYRTIGNITVARPKIFPSLGRCCRKVIATFAKGN